MTLTLKLAHQSFHITLHPIMMHHHTKFGYLRFSGSGDIGQTSPDISNHHCNLDLEHSNPVISQDTLANDDVPHTKKENKFDCKRVRSLKDTIDTIIL